MAQLDRRWQATTVEKRGGGETNRSNADTIKQRSYWLADKDGNVTRALGWTWRILKRREPRKYRWWISRANHAREPTPEALVALKALKQAADGGSRR